MKVQCCRCKKFRVGKEWEALEAPPSDKISHGFCPPCLTQTRKEYEAEMRAFAREQKEKKLRSRWTYGEEAV